MTAEKTDKRTDIMKAAMELIAEQGFHGTPTSQIAQRAGTGVGTIYRYFKDKDELIEAIHEKVHVRFTHTFAENNDPQRSVRENYLRIFNALTRTFIANPSEIRFMEQYYNAPYGIARKRDDGYEGEKPLFRFFEQGKRQQVIKDFPMEVLMSLSFGPIVFVTRDHLNGFINLDDAMIAAIVEASWDAVKR